MTTSPLHFSGQRRDAARHLLDNTPLGSAVDLFGRISDEDTLLTVELDAGQLSRGERHLWQFLSSLSGWGAVNIASLLGDIDSDCALACAWSLGMASGHFAASTPVRFGAL